MVKYAGSLGLVFVMMLSGEHSVEICSSLFVQNTEEKSVASHDYSCTGPGSNKWVKPGIRIEAAGQ